MNQITISSTELARKVADIIHLVENQRKIVVVTRFGRQVAKISSAENEPPKKSLFGCGKDTLQIHGDIFSTGESWEADEYPAT